MNVAELEMGLKDLVSTPFDQSEFVYKLLELYNAPPATIKKLRSGGSNKADLVGDILWQRKLYFRTAEPGQTGLILDVLKQRKPTKAHKPRFIITTDGKEISALDTKLDQTLHCEYQKLNDNFDFFLPLAGIEKYAAIDETEADVKAAGRLAHLHDEIMRSNPGWKTPEKRHALNQFMTRILFCLFSEDTGSFKEDIFIKIVTEYGGEDGEHLQSLFKQIFDIMNVPEEQRKNLPVHIAAFPYVNGGLFADQTDVPAFSKRAKRLLMEAAELDWKEINPDIFGSMIQAVVDEDMRGDLGMHYTSVPNIMKVLQPLFLMNLEEELAGSHDNRYERDRLYKLLEHISKIRVFDPACGSGNFLIIAYQELRKLEMRIFQRLDELEGGQITHRWGTGIKLSNFYGIEITDFAAETAKLSLWIAEYQMNQRFKMLFGETRNPFPLVEGGHIVHDNALHCDWHEICPPPEDETVETYIVGNPPYLGRTYQDKEQKQDIISIFAKITKNFKKLDYVACWFWKATEYIQKTNASYALVTTNSICQGEQVALLWSLILKQPVEIFFAHNSFEWKNLAAQGAGITCSIVGVRNKSNEPKYLFEGEHRKKVENINAYLTPGDNVIVHAISNAKTSKPVMKMGNMAADGGGLLLSGDEYKKLVEQFPAAQKILKRTMGSKEFVSGIERWCLWVPDELENLALSMPPVKKRIEATKKMRLESKDSGTRSLAERPHQLREMHCAKEHLIIVPKVTTGVRKYFPAGILSADFLVTDLAFAIYDAPIHWFAIISSKLHLSWIHVVCGKMRSHYRYSNTLGYNTFPIPPLSTDQKAELEEHAWAIIGARDAHPGKTITWLYDPKTMPKNLLDAHLALDDCLEKIYIGRPFKDDTERLEHLFKMYEKMVAKKGVKK